MKLLSTVGSVIATVSKFVTGTAGAVGNTATLAVNNTIQAAGGRKFFYGFYILPAFVIAASVMKIDPATTQMTVGAMAGCIGIEGVADIKQRTGGSWVETKETE